jgi:hypothetical protein
MLYKGAMLAVKLHRTLKPRLVKESCLMPIVDWKSGRVQIQTWLKWNKRDRYITLVRIPADHPVRITATATSSSRWSGRRNSGHFGSGRRSIAEPLLSGGTRPGGRVTSPGE